MNNLKTIKSVLRGKKGTSCEIPASVPTNEHAQSRLYICTGKKMLKAEKHVHVSNIQPLNNISSSLVKIIID